LKNSCSFIIAGVFLFLKKTSCFDYRKGALGIGAFIALSEVGAKKKTWNENDFHLSI